MIWMKVFIRAASPLLLHSLFLIIYCWRKQISFRSSSVIALMLMSLPILGLLMWLFIVNGILPLAEWCIFKPVHQKKAHVVMLYRRHDVYCFPWMDHALIKLSNERKGFYWIGKLDESIQKDSRVEMTYLRKTGIILSIKPSQN